jgi:glutathione synthase/RimK-type ligase-like ATP-grasp enzyme
MPKTIRITPVSVKNVQKQVTDAGMTTPFIIRAAGAHGGVGMQYIANFSEEELLKLERYAYDGSTYYITEFIDFKNADGLYRKSRIIYVNGKFIARHRIISDSWMIHSRSRKTLMETCEDLRHEEEAFLTQPLDKSLGATATKSLRKMADIVGLDYFGIDCSLQDDGTIILFEVNAAFNSMVQDDLPIYPYLEKPVTQIKEAFNVMVAEKAKSALVA